METGTALRGIIYASKALVGFDAGALDCLEVRAAARNAQLRVTGYLYFDDGRFFQYLEGGHDAVTALMGRIELDRRHDVKHVLYDDRLGARRFPSWSMRVLQRAQFAGLDSLVYDHVVFMQQATPSRPDASASVWHLIERVRNLRERLITPSAP